MVNKNRKITELSVIELEKLIGSVVRGNIVAYLKPNEEPQDLVTIEVAMTITNLARQTIYSKINNGLPHIKTKGTKRLKFSRKALLLWMTEGGAKLNGGNNGK